jgi:hypothetical protein
MPVTQSKLDKCNNKRKDKNYRVSESGIEVYGTPDKQKLTESPFVRHLEYGAKKMDTGIITTCAFNLKMLLIGFNLT